MPLHTGKGRSVSTTIADIIDYVEHPQKTDNGKLITGYACDTRTADGLCGIPQSRLQQKIQRGARSRDFDTSSSEKIFLGTEKLPSVKVLREEYSKLLARKRKAYAEYKAAREEMKELYNVKSNVEHLLNISEPEPEREREKTRR